MGSAAELGAFINNSETISKVIVLQNVKFKNIKSFISEGPIKYMKKKYKNHVLYYKNDPNKIANQLKSILKKEKECKKKNVVKRINTLKISIALVGNVIIYFSFCIYLIV